jgi:hypothetical protein
MLLCLAPAMAQSANSQNLLRNGDFSEGFTGWTAGVLTPSQYAGYPRWGIVGTVGRGNGLSAYLDVSGGAAAYLESDSFMLPEGEGASLNTTLWGTLNPTILQVEIRTQAGVYPLDSLTPPMVESGQQPVMKQYRIPGNFSGQNISIRFTCADTAPAHANGAYCAFANLAVLQLPAVNMYASYAMIAGALGLAAAGVAMANGSSSGTSSGSSTAQGKPPLFSLRWLALLLAGYLSKKYCCVCAGKCNHKGPHSFCPAHDPRTFPARMDAVYKVYCRYCGKKLEDHECKGPITEPQEPLLAQETVGPESSQNKEQSQSTSSKPGLRSPP